MRPAFQGASVRVLAGRPYNESVRVKIIRTDVRRMSKTIQIAVVGSGYVGLVAAVCFAEMGHDVICVDNDESKVAALQGGDTLIHEDHLPELLNRYRNGRVRFMTDLGEATREC